MLKFNNDILDFRHIYINIFIHTSGSSSQDSLLLAAAIPADIVSAIHHGGAAKHDAFASGEKWWTTI